MTKLVTIDVTEQSVEANGHPTECTNPAPGTVDGDSSVTVANASGDSSGIATIDNADMNIPTHSHDYSGDDGCHDNASHTLDPDVSNASSSITINGSPVYIVGTGVTTDPKSGDNVDLSEGLNNSVTE